MKELSKKIIQKKIKVLNKAVYLRDLGVPKTYSINKREKMKII